MWLFDLFFPQFCKSDMSRYGYLEVFKRFLGIRDVCVSTPVEDPFILHLDMSLLCTWCTAIWYCYIKTNCSRPNKQQLVYLIWKQSYVKGAFICSKACLMKNCNWTDLTILNVGGSLSCQMFLVKITFSVHYKDATASQEAKDDILPRTWTKEDATGRKVSCRNIC